MGNETSSTQSGLDKTLNDNFESTEVQKLKDWYSSAARDDKDFWSVMLVPELGDNLWKESNGMQDAESFFKLIMILLRGTTDETYDFFYKSVKSAEVEGGTIDGDQGPIRIKLLLLLLIEASEAGMYDSKEGEVKGFDAVRCADLADKMFIMVNTFHLTISEDRYVALGSFKEFVEAHIPYCCKVLRAYYSTKLGILQDSECFKAPIVFHGKESSSILHSSMDLLPLALYHDSAQGEWFRLYSSDEDGFDFSNIQESIVGYAGPTCLLIKTRPTETHSTPAIFGAVVEAPWKQSQTYYGDSQSFLFTLEPTLQIYKNEVGGDGLYQWLNTSTYDKTTHGLGIGGCKDMHQFRIFIPQSLEGCVARDTCETFASGPLIPPARSTDGKVDSVFEVNDAQQGEGNFEIGCIEIWAIGGAECVETGMKAMAESQYIKKKTIEKARKIDKAQFFNNEFDREMFLGGQFQHRKDIERR